MKNKIKTAMARVAAYAFAKGVGVYVRVNSCIRNFRKNS